ncbi:Kv channel-interacting protein 4 [Arapaima gigas]
MRRRDGRGSHWLAPAKRAADDALTHPSNMSAHTDTHTRNSELIRLQACAVMSVSTPVKRSHKWRQDLQQFRQNHGISKKVLRSCCLVRHIKAWVSPHPKGTPPTA